MRFFVLSYGERLSRSHLHCKPHATRNGLRPYNSIAQTFPRKIRQRFLRPQAISVWRNIINCKPRLSRADALTRIPKYSAKSRRIANSDRRRAAETSREQRDI